MQKIADSQGVDRCEVHGLSHHGGKPKLRSDHLFQTLNDLDPMPTNRSKTGLLLSAISEALL